MCAYKQAERKCNAWKYGMRWKIQNQKRGIVWSGMNRGEIRNEQNT
jgi:hypothetical protein